MSARGEAADIAVEAQNLTKTFGLVVAVRDVSFSVESGGYFVLRGHSGGG